VNVASPATTAPRRAVLGGSTIVVVGIYYAPDLTGIAPYTTRLCEMLAAAGASVNAVVGVPHYPQWRVGHRRSFISRESHRGVQLHRVRHFVPRQQNILGRAMYEASFALASGIVGRGLRADAVLAVTPSLGAVPSAAAVARRCGAPLGVFVQDLVGQAASQAGLEGGNVVAPFVRRLEGRWISAATSVAVIDESFRKRLVDLGVSPKSIEHIPNFTHVTTSVLSRDEARRELGWPADKSLLVHTGNMGYKQGLENVIAAARLALTHQPELEFVLVGDGSARLKLQKLSADLPNVRFVPPLSDVRYPVALAAADCLLVNERATVRDMSLPSKLTSYFCAQRPVLGAVRADGATAAELRRSGGGIRVDPGCPIDLVTAASRILRNGALASALAAAGGRYACTHLSQEKASERLIDFAVRLLDDRAGTERYKHSSAHKTCELRTVSKDSCQQGDET
jgi:colanic acid biosynthesis glycosyl transferase WcaI